MVAYEKVYNLTKNLNVLYVEDDINFQKETSELFNYFFDSVDLANNGQEGLEKYLSYYEKNTKFYDIVITDINMPQINGIELSKKIYTHNDKQPILIVSAHDEKHYLIELINIGVESFLMKPVHYDKVIEVLNSVSTRLTDNISIIPDTHLVDLGDKFQWDKKTKTLLKNTKNIKLTKKEIALMEIFIKNDQAVTTNEVIFDILWEDSFESASIQNLQPIISRLRKKLPKNLLHNIYGLGYKLVF